MSEGSCDHDCYSLHLRNNSIGCLFEHIKRPLLMFSCQAMSLSGGNYECYVLADKSSHRLWGWSSGWLVVQRDHCSHPIPFQQSTLVSFSHDQDLSLTLTKELSQL